MEQLSFVDQVSQLDSLTAGCTCWKPFYIECEEVCIYAKQRAPKNLSPPPSPRKDHDRGGGWGMGRFAELWPRPPFLGGGGGLRARLPRVIEAFVFVNLPSCPLLS